MTEHSQRHRLAELSRDIARAHHRAYADVDGKNPNWALWYADHLRRPLGELLGREFQTDELAKELTAVDAEQRERAPESDWPTYYADWFLARYTSS